MRKIKKILFILFITVVLMICAKVSKVEAATYSISASQSTVTVGTTVTVTASVNAGSWNLLISGNGVNQPLLGETQTTSNTNASASASFTPTEPGTYTFYLTGDVTDYETEVTETGISKSVTITVNPVSQPEPDPNPSTGGDSGTTQDTPNESNVPTETKKPETPQVTKSSNNYLSGITVGTGTLSPEFYRETFDYTVEFDDTVNLYDLKEIEISATAEDDRATVEGAGTIQLNEGENNIALTVTAENGSARTYNIKVVKPEAVDQSSLRLKTLVLNGINTSGEYQTINLDFNPDTFEYNITVPNSITSISVNPTTENEDIIIESNGGENLNEGENKIIIILTSPSDDTIKTTYTINIERQVALTTVEEHGLNNKQLGIVIIAVIVGVILLIVIIIAIVKHRKKKKGFGFDDDEEDNEIHFINNEEGEDIKDYDEIESPYPDKIVTSEMPNEEKSKESSEDYKKVDEENLNNIDKKESKEDNAGLKFKTTYDEENIESDNHAKSKWDDFVDGYQDEEESEKTKKKKRGRRFL